MLFALSSAVSNVAIIPISSAGSYDRSSDAEKERGHQAQGMAAIITFQISQQSQHQAHGTVLSQDLLLGHLHHSQHTITSWQSTQLMTPLAPRLSAEPQHQCSGCYFSSILSNRNNLPSSSYSACDVAACPETTFLLDEEVFWMASFLGQGLSFSGV